jgi:tetratricopeptide (TPR) repeat protein
VLLSFEGAVKIADFGIAAANLFREEPGTLKGKTGYMSPEQARAERVDRRSDIYSLGVVLHELLTGRPLHGAAEGQELLDAVRGGQVEPPSTFAREIDAELEAVVMQALARNREERFQTARDLSTAITRLLFQRQALVDNAVLEAAIADLVGREHTSPGASHPPASLEDGSVAAAALGTGEPEAGSRAGEEQTGPGRPVRRRLRERVGREVRHVAVMTLRLHGVERLEPSLGAQRAARFVRQLRATLDEIAFKRGARWAWSPAAVPAGPAAAIAGGARALIGLLANPSRAAIDAATLAIDVHEALRAACDDAEVELEASVAIVRGIAAGERDQAGHLVNHELIGPAEYLAKIVGDQAPAGATWVAGGLYRLVRRDFVWADAPTIQIEDAAERDLPRNMRIHALQRPLTREEKLQEMAQAPSDLIGRDAELADLQAAYHRSVTPKHPGGLGQVVSRVVIGEMGIGKTALVTAFVAELPPETRVLRFECSPARSEIPFANVSEWVRELTGIRPDGPLEDAKQAILETLGDLAAGRNIDAIVTRLAELTTGGLADAADEAEVAHNKRLIASGMRRFFARAALERPLVAVIDSVQWIDRASLELIVELVKGGDPLPILATLITRPDERVGPTLERIVRIELKGLRTENQIRLLQARLGATEGVAHVCADLLPRAAGNPFFLLEMVDALLERGALEIREVEGGKHELIRVEHGGEAERALPSTLEQLIADRLNELPAEEHAVVDWLAVAGSPVTEAALATLIGSDVEEPIARLCARGLCDRKGEAIDVRHPLTRDVAYLALDREERTRMHRRLGQQLRGTRLARGLSAALVARHLLRGRAPDQAAELYLEAAAAARTGYQMQLATRYYRRVLSMLGRDDVRRLEAHEALEGICRIQGRWRERRRHLAELRRLARASAKPTWAATALVRSARLHLDEARLARGLSAAQQAEHAAQHARSAPLEIEARLLMAEMLRDLGDMQGALAACDRALETCARVDVGARIRAEVLRMRGTLLRRVGRVHEAVDAHAEAIAVFRKVGARRLEARAKNSLAFAMFILGRFEDAIALALDAIRIDLAIGGRLQIAKTLSNIGQSYARLGDIARGKAYLKRARDAHERYGDQDSRADTLLSTAEVLLEAGEIEAAESFVGDAGALIQVTGSAYDSVHEKILRALIARSGGDSGAAVMHAFDARQAAEAQAYVAFLFHAMAVEAAARVDIGEQHTGILLATMAMGASDAIQGSEYGLETRALACEALERAGSPQAAEMRDRAAVYARKMLGHVRDPYFRSLFLKRPIVARLLAAEAAEAAGS